MTSNELIDELTAAIDDLQQLREKLRKDPSLMDSDRFIDRVQDVGFSLGAVEVTA